MRSKNTKGVYRRTEMKELVCKKCGSNALEQHDSVFECSDCHAKFLVQEYDVTNGANADRISQLDTLYQLAENARMNKDYVTALKHYETANSIDSSDWKALFYIEYCKAMCSTLSNVTLNANRFANSSEKILNCLNGRNEADLRSILLLIAKRVNDVSYNLGLIVMENPPELSRINELYSSWQEIFNIGYTWGNCIVSIFGQQMGVIASECWVFSTTEQNRFLNSFQQWLSPNDVQAGRNTINQYAATIRQYKSDFTLPIKQSTQQTNSSGGCYIATCVYGSYDCPQVWTLRRYRDDSLAKTWYGRTFIHVYYALSPIVVRLFGNTSFFKTIWRKRLDNMVDKLHSQGVQNTPYEDKRW